MAGGTLRWVGLMMWACAGEVDPADRGGDDTGVPAMSVSIEPAVAWGDVPLRCLPSRPGATLRWLVDGVPWDGAATTTLPGDTVPAAALVAGQTWTCVAAARDLAIAHVDVRPPNVLILLADDLGYGDLGSYGGEPTPRLDDLAAQGVRFTSAYAAAPVCGPSRAGLLTARQPSRYGFEYNVEDDPIAVGRGLPLAERTLGDRMRQQGYATALFGKWHLGFAPGFHPNLRGFDHFFGFLNGRRPTLPPGLPGAVDYEVSAEEIASWPASPGGWGVEENGTAVTLDERHLTDRLADEWVAWVDQQDRPFFALLSFNAVHIPLQATSAQLAAVASDADPAVWTYRANLAVLDTAIGRVLDALEVRGLAEHTIVVFSSDNGCPSIAGFCSNGELAGGKLQLTEGGLRVPLIVRWPDRLAPGEVRAEPVSHMDLLPTVVAAGGGAVDPSSVDGVDLLPWLLDPELPPPHEVLYWRMLPLRAIRRGANKLVDSTTGTWRFDVVADPGEGRNLQQLDPPLSRTLADELDARSRLYVPPAWIGRPAIADYYGSEQPILF